MQPALQEHRYNKTRPAAALGIATRALRYKLKKLGIDWRLRPTPCGSALARDSDNLAHPFSPRQSGRYRIDAPLR
ncbi:hypothetical protein CMZ84_04470 [Lysobacteraceae bacterium NML93-0399]|nr:hypothetical protein CMZ84_04470 [Xanthomonadaceae bacterium NML93-0399]